MDIEISKFSLRKLFKLGRLLYNETLNNNLETTKGQMKNKSKKSIFFFFFGLSLMIYINYISNQIYLPLIFMVLFNIISFIFTFLVAPIFIVGQININYTIYPFLWFSVFLYSQKTNKKTSFIRIENHKILFLNKRKKILRESECLQLVDYHGYLAFAGYKKNRLIYNFVCTSSLERDNVVREIENEFSISPISTNNLQETKALLIKNR